MDEQPNRLRETQRLCGWCDQHFEIERRPGRPKIYCGRSCRQRAYERRRGLGVLPPPDRIIMQPGGPTAHLIQRAPGYEAGQTSLVGAPTHAMRPAGISDRRGRRLTLCGTLAFPVARNYSDLLPGACLTCSMVQTVRPSAQPVRLSADLAAVRSLLDQAAIEASRSERSEHPVRPTGEILFDLIERVAGIADIDAIARLAAEAA